MALAVPGAGHLMVGQNRKAAIFFVVLVAMFLIGLQFKGELFPFQMADPLVFLAAMAQWAMVLFRFGAEMAGAGRGDVVAVTYEYGNTFLIVAGLAERVAGAGCSGHCAREPSRGDLASGNHDSVCRVRLDRLWDAVSRHAPGTAPPRRADLRHAGGGRLRGRVADVSRFLNRRFWNWAPVLAQMAVHLRVLESLHETELPGGFGDYTVISSGTRFLARS
jgi:hypothetical protein